MVTPQSPFQHVSGRILWNCVYMAIWEVSVGFQEHLLAFQSSQVESVRNPNKFYCPVPRPWSISSPLQTVCSQWEPVSQHKTDKWSLGIQQIWIRPGSKHLPGPVYNLKQLPAFPQFAGSKPVMQSQRSNRVSATGKVTREGLRDVIPHDHYHLF